MAARSDSSPRPYRSYRKLRLLIVEAEHLQKRDVFGLSDPYVRVRFDNAKHSHKVTSNKTNTIKKTLHPVWNEVLDFYVREDQFSIMLDIFDENLLIPDDFLGRACLHFDLTDRNPETGPCVSNDPITLEDEIRTKGKPLMLTLGDKYADNHFDGFMAIPHVRIMNGAFLDKRIHKTREHEDNWGTLQLFYIFEEAPNNRLSVSDSSPSPWTTPPLTTPPLLSVQSMASEATSATPSSEEEEEDDQSLPAGWELRVDSNRRQMYIHRDHRRVSLRRPNLSMATPTSEGSADVGRRRFQNRSDSIDVINEPRGVSLLSISDPLPPEAGEGTAVGPGRDLSLLESPVQSGAQFIVGGDTATVGGALDIVGTATVTVGGASATVGGATVSVGEATVGEATVGGATVGGATVTVGEASVNPPLGPTETPQLTTAQQRASQGLPPGWVAGMSQDGRIYYIDHNTTSTSWEKPRLLERRPNAEETGQGAQQAEQDTDLLPGWEVRKAKDGRTYYVDHNTHTTVWENPKETTNKLAHEDELGPLPSNWAIKQMSDGRIFYVDHITHSTQWEDPRLLAKNKPTYKIQYSRDYKQKYVNFRTKLGPKHQVPRQCQIPCRRTFIFEDSYNFIMNIRDVELLKSRLYVEFQGETGLDYGGVAREWFHLLSHEMFNPYYGLFEYSASDDYTLQISPNSGTYNEHHLDYFKFVGRVCAMAVYHNRLIDAFFIRPFYKMMLDRPLTLEDMQAVDIEMHHSFNYILENDPDPLCLDFSVNKSVFGEVTVVDLKPNGRDITVTENNKKEYLDLMMKWRFSDRVQQQMKSFMKGFTDLIPQRLIKVFDEREMEYLLGGLAEIDLDDWRNNTDIDGYQTTDNVIVWFWKAVENYDNEMRARLLQFVTGTSKVPMNGFSELQGSQGPRKFCIKKFGPPNSLPRAHTCFNRMDLPPYPNYHKLKEMLRLAVENTEGFEGVD